MAIEIIRHYRSFNSGNTTINNTENRTAGNGKYFTYSYFTGNKRLRA